MDVRLRVSGLVPSRFASPEAARSGARKLLWLLNALCEVDVELRLSGWSLPPLYQSGVRYSFSPEGPQDWLGSLDLRSEGRGSCRELAPDRAAELRVAGVRAFPRVSWHPQADGSLLYHVTVLREPPRAGEHLPGYADNPRVLFPAPRDESQGLGGGEWFVEDPSRVLGMDGVHYPSGERT